MKERLDVLLVKRNLAESREKAKAIIMSGNVFVDGEREDKAGTSFSDDVSIEIKGHTLPYVSRGGLKLEKAIQNFDVSVEGKVCTDVGSSTGGFTDCMLQNGAVKVFAIDVGRGQLAWKLRQDERVVCMEKTNIRYVLPRAVQRQCHFGLRQFIRRELRRLLQRHGHALRNPEGRRYRRGGEETATAAENPGLLQWVGGRNLWQRYGGRRGELPADQ